MSKLTLFYLSLQAGSDSAPATEPPTPHLDEASGGAPAQEGKSGVKSQNLSKQSHLLQEELEVTQRGEHLSL